MYLHFSLPNASLPFSFQMKIHHLNMLIPNHYRHRIRIPGRITGNYCISSRFNPDKNKMTIRICYSRFISTNNSHHRSLFNNTILVYHPFKTFISRTNTFQSRVNIISIFFWAGLWPPLSFQSFFCLKQVPNSGCS